MIIILMGNQKGCDTYYTAYTCNAQLYITLCNIGVSEYTEPSSHNAGSKSSNRRTHASDYAKSSETNQDLLKAASLFWKVDTATSPDSKSKGYKPALIQVAT